VIPLKYQISVVIESKTKIDDNRALNVFREFLQAIERKLGKDFLRYEDPYLGELEAKQIN
jgi:hypothetical protein